MPRDNSWQYRSSNRQTYASPYARYLKGFDLQNQFIKEDGEPDADGNPTELYKFPEQAATFDRYWTVTRYPDLAAKYFVWISGSAIYECSPANDLTFVVDGAYTHFLTDGIYLSLPQSVNLSDSTANLNIAVTETDIEFIAIAEVTWSIRNLPATRTLPFAPFSPRVQAYSLFSIWSDKPDPIQAFRTFEGSVAIPEADRSGIPTLQSNGKYLLTGKFLALVETSNDPMLPPCNLSGSDFYRLKYRIVKPPLLKSSRYTCNCPDFTRIQEADPMLDFPSRQIRRDWDASQAGAPKDEANNKGDRICKHIWAVKLSVGDEIVTPTY